MAQPRQCPVVAHRARSNQLVQSMGERQNARHPVRTPLWFAYRLGRQGACRKASPEWERIFNLHDCHHHSFRASASPRLSCRVVEDVLHDGPNEATGITQEEYLPLSFCDM